MPLRREKVIDDQTVESQAAFARRLGITRQSVNAMVDEGLPTVGPDRRVLVADALAWIRDRRPRGKAVEVAGGGGGGADFLAAKTALLLVQVERQQLQLERERGAFMPSDVAIRALKTFSIETKQAWERFADRHGMHIAAELGIEARVVMAVLERYVRIQLHENAQMHPPIIQNTAGEMVSLDGRGIN